MAALISGPPQLLGLRIEPRLQGVGLAAVVGHSITYRIAVGSNEGRKAFTLQTVPAALESPTGDERLAKHSGLSLHAGVAAAAHQRHKVERLCRYIQTSTFQVRSKPERAYRESLESITRETQRLLD